MRRILRKIAEGEADKLGDTSTLADPSIVEVSRHHARSHKTNACEMTAHASFFTRESRLDLKPRHL